MRKILIERSSYLASLIAAVFLVFLPWRQVFTYSLPARVQDGLTIFLGIFLEALPFVLLGVLVSAVIRRFVTPQHLARLIPASPLLAFPLVSLLGLVFPVCECGNLPVARQLIRQGMRPSQAITFLLSAPILNPAVIITTYAAFRFMPGLVVARLLSGFLVAVLVGWFFYLRGDKDLVKPEQEGESCPTNHGGLEGIVDELLEMMSALCLGAFIASVIQITVSRSFLLEIGASPVAAILVMMLLALLVSLCSNVDAFFALSFSSTFSASSLLGFLVFGPMIDFRALSLFSRIFKGKTIALMTLLVFELVFLVALMVHHWGIL